MYLDTNLLDQSDKNRHMKTPKDLYNDHTKGNDNEPNTNVKAYININKFKR